MNERVSSTDVLAPTWLISHAHRPIKQSAETVRHGGGRAVGAAVTDLAQRVMLENATEQAAAGVADAAGVTGRSCPTGVGGQSRCQAARSSPWSWR